MELKPPVPSLLIANRGEIVVRIARTCRALGVRSITVYSDADKNALHVRACDEAIGIGGTSPRDSYLRADRILDAAVRSRAAALHPGYGFLSENADFAQACLDAGLTFVGPTPSAMRAVGDKIAAKQTAAAAGVPILAGYAERDQSPHALRDAAARIALPLLVKAAAGGGGRGMRLVTDMAAFDEAIESAQREARAAFGDPTVFLERFVQSPRHIEVQILADTHGRCIALGERECSIQRRYQKILEESPSPAVTPALRAKLEQAAIAIATAVGYVNAGTVEFVLDEEGQFFFLEMNARLQVEHPVTEMVTGIDLVAEQLSIAAGAPLALAHPSQRGHAIEVRIYAEDPASGFLPSTGLLTAFVPPDMPHVRNDVAVTHGSRILAAYDPMLAKLIVHASDRRNAVALLARALDAYQVGGVATNLGFLRWLVARPEFKEGTTTTDFIDRHFRLEDLQPQKGRRAAMLAAAGALPELRTTGDAERSDPWQTLGQWRHSAMPDEVALADGTVQVERSYAEDAWRASLDSDAALVRNAGEGTFQSLEPNGADADRFTAWLDSSGTLWTAIAGSAIRFARPAPPTDTASTGHRHSGTASRGAIEAPMSGTVVKINVTVGDAVKAMAVLMVVEAMKMEHALAAPYAARVSAVKVQVGQSVAAGEVLVELEES